MPKTRRGLCRWAALAWLLGGLAGGAAAAAEIGDSPSEAGPRVFVSFLQDNGKGCDWIKAALPDGKKEVVASFPCSCFGARVSWKPDLGEAVVWFDPGNYLKVGYGGYGLPEPGYPDEDFQEFKDQLYLVGFPSGKTRLLPFPHLTAEQGPQDIAYTQDGRLAAFDTLYVKTPRPDDYLARAFAYKNGKWVLFEKKPTSDERCDALGIRALNSVLGTGPESLSLLDAHSGGDNVEDKPTLARLAKMQPPGLGKNGGMWIKIKTEYGPVYMYEAALADYSFNSGLILLERQGRLQRLPDEGFTAGDLVGVLVQGPYLLVASHESGCHPRVYDLRTDKLVFKSDMARAAVFWPESNDASGDP